MISESIKAVTRLVIKPGLVNVGLDDLVTALETNRSRCLFGSGIAKGKNRAQAALKNALSSPLLDRGSLLEDAESVMVHVSGGPDMTLYEVELLMQGLTKHVPEKAHILFGAAIDESMEDSLSVTVISALPENKLTATMSSEGAAAGGSNGSKVSVFETVEEDDDFVVEDGNSEEEDESGEEDEWENNRKEEVVDGFEEPEWEELNEDESQNSSEDEDEEADEEDRKPLFQPISKSKPKREEPDEEPTDSVDELDDEEDEESGIIPLKSAKTDEKARNNDQPAKKEVAEEELSSIEDSDWAEVHQPKRDGEGSRKTKLPEKRSATGKKKEGQGELELEGGPKGRFEGEDPNLVDGEDLDVPPYLRKRAKS
jgi:cell division protein FtsZ